MKEGKASVNFKKLYGFYLDDEGNPQVNSDQAEAVRSIFDQYLQGASLRMIRLSLEEKKVLNPTGGAKWDISQIRSILGNEKYCGDVLMQKTFTQDCINKKVIKNTGQLPQYGSCRGYHKTQWCGAATSKYHMWGQPLSGSLGGRSQSRSGRCAFRPFYGTGQTYKGDEKCRRIARQNSSRYTTSILGVGKCSRSLLQRHTKRRRLSVCPRGDRPN